jgi:type III pantothenate kinase
VKLLIDIGNTRIKWAFDQDAADGAVLLAQGECVHRDIGLAEAMGFVAELGQVPDEVVAVNVAGKAIEAALAAAVWEKFGLQLMLVRTAARFGPVTNGYRATEQLGADRWAAIVGAWFLRRKAVCVIDAGTAITMDAVAANGQHLGGIIVPGVSLMEEALFRDTSDIRGFSVQGFASSTAADWYGDDTRSAVAKGARYLLRAAINRAIGDMAENGVLPLVMLTGGDAEKLAQLLESAYEHRPMLVLEGLHYLTSGEADA